jgi:hypothetical protein
VWPLTFPARNVALWLAGRDKKASISFFEKRNKKTFYPASQYYRNVLVPLPNEQRFFVIFKKEHFFLPSEITTGRLRA